VLRTEAEISAYLHRARMAILDVLQAGPATSSQVAARLGVHPANLTRHLRVLSAAGLIVLTETRDTGRNLEKYYARVADRFVVEPDPGGLASPHRIALTFAQSQLAAALVRLPERVEEPVAALSLTVRLSAARAREFADELSRLARRFGEDEEAGHPYEAVLALFPGEGPAGQGATRSGDGLPSRNTPTSPPAPGTVRLSRDGGERS
jgi:DNA-binding transcriptional ArsR family regulator